MARNRGGDSFVAHTESAVAPVKSSAICDYVAPRFRETATPESIISTTCAPHSGRNCRRSVRDQVVEFAGHSLRTDCHGRLDLADSRGEFDGAVLHRSPSVFAAGRHGRPDL